MMFKKTLVGLAVAGSIITAAFAAGLYPDFPIVGGATYCAGTSSSATGTIIGVQTGCPNQVPAGPTILTGNEQIAADTRLGQGINPATVLVPMASLNALPITFVTVTLPPTGISAANNSGGVCYVSTTTITAANITLPANPIDGQQYAVCSNRTITALSVTGSIGNNFIGGNVAPTTITASTASPSYGIRFIYRASDTSWYRLI